MLKVEKDKSFFEFIKQIFAKKIEIKNGDVGICYYVWSCDSFNNEYKTFKYDVFVKIMVKEIYNDIVRVEVLEIDINDYASEHIINFIKETFPKYINVKNINWINK